MAVKLSVAEEEALIRKRLLTQTKIKDSPITKLTRKYVEFMNVAEEQGVEETEKVAEDLLKELAQYQLSMDRVASISSVIDREQANYQTLKESLTESIAQAARDIETLRGELEEAQLERNHKEEYEVLKKMCTEHPLRRSSRAAISAIENEIAALEREGMIANSKLELRRKQFALLLHAADELEQELQEDDIALRLQVRCFYNDPAPEGPYTLTLHGLLYVIRLQNPDSQSLVGAFKLRSFKKLL